jgi:hypothetical protein
MAIQNDKKFYPNPAMVPSEQAKLRSIQFKGVILCNSEEKYE